MTTNVPPQVRDEDWFARFKRELELRGATGREIGEAAASVDEYCRDAGVRAPDAFGDPVAYAASLRGTGLHLGRMALTLAAVIAGLWAFLLSLWIPIEPSRTGTLGARPLLLQVAMMIACTIGILLWPRAAQKGRVVIFFVLFMAAQLGANLLADAAPNGWGITLRGWQWALVVSALAPAGAWGIRASIANRVIDPRRSPTPQLDRWRSWAPWLVYARMPPGDRDARPDRLSVLFRANPARDTIGACPAHSPIRRAASSASGCGSPVMWSVPSSPR